MAKGRIGRGVWIFAAVAVVGVATVALGGLQAAPPAPGAEGAVADRPAQPVRVTRAAFVAEQRGASYTGTIRPRHEAALGFRVAGKVLERRVEVGDRVRAGQVLARLDDSDARLELEIAAAEAAAARTDLSRAEADLARARALKAEGHVTAAALDRAVSAAAEAAAREDRARRARDLAANRLGYAVLRATEDGIVTATPAEAGQVIPAGQPVVTLARAGALDVVFALPEQDRGWLEGASFRAELWGAAGAGYDLTLRDVAPDVDPAARTYRVRLAMVAPDAAATLGRTVTVRLDLPGGAETAALPLAAVLNDGSGPAVWRVLPDGARVERVPVEIASVEGEVARVRGALAEGDAIVSLGAHKIDPARPVRVVETQETPES